MIAILALESGKAWLFAIPDSAKEGIEGFLNAFERVLLNASQVVFDFRQRAGIGQMARLFDVAENLTSNPVTRYSLGKGGRPVVHRPAGTVSLRRITDDDK